MRWNYSLRTLFLLMLVVAAFCFGWVCKERWDGTPLSTLLTSPSQTEPIVKALTAECDKRLEEIAKRQLQPEASRDDVPSGSLSQDITISFRQRELIQSIKLVISLSAELERLERARHKALFPYWYPGTLVGGSLMVSIWVVSCIVAMRIGVCVTQGHSRTAQH